MSTLIVELQAVIPGCRHVRSSFSNIVSLAYIASRWVVSVMFAKSYFQSLILLSCHVMS